MAFARLIIALDGSARAEEGLAYVERTWPRGATEGTAQPILLLASAVEPVRERPMALARAWAVRLFQPPPPTAHRPVGAADAELMAAAQTYLDQQALALRLRGWRVESFVRWGDPGTPGGGRARRPPHLRCRPR